MYSIEEAVAEHDEVVAAEGENEHNEFNNHVISRLPSFRPQITKGISRKPSFFARMFSTRKLNRILAEEEEEDEEVDTKLKNMTTAENDQQKTEGEEEGGMKEGADEEGDGEQRNEGKDKDDMNQNDDEQDAVPALETRRKADQMVKDLEDELAEALPMPMIGKPTNMDALIARNRAAELGMNTLMEMVNREVEISLFDAKHIPVSKDYDRVTVSQEVSNYMNKVRSEKQIERRVKGNNNSIQKALNYRKSAVIIMNVNYSNQTVRKIEPIYTQEARTIVVFK